MGNKKPYSNTIYIRKKNALVLRVTGVTVVPDSQIIETPLVLLEEGLIPTTLSIGICTYCITFSADSSCSKCPMSIEDNRCDDANIFSTWYNANLIWRQKATSTDIQELIDLVEEHNTKVREALCQ